ncbi:MAG: ABC transporter substrate-binding protein [Oscillatoriophycideae cyanobacterium NC_groundwater_1537_Pr4_S-0.65um_50_18]|nr:ABC transporter substrate-binding protein [Oscillatoriophycideae cyanobacterium NC_groundwater_1537_Pr4_S-0.65um_50_18]
MQLKRRDVLLGLVGLSLPIISSSCASGTPQASSGATGSPAAAGSPAASGAVADKVRIGYQVVPNAELLAKALGLAQKAFPNSQVQYVSFDSGRDVNTAFAAKGIDFGLIGSVPTSVGIARNLPYYVYFIHDVIGSAEALIVKDTVKVPADLKGKKIGTPFGSTAHFSLLNLLKLENIDQKDLTILDLQPPDLVAAWQRGDIDGGYVWQPNLSKLQKAGGTLLKTSADLAKQGVVTADVGVVSKEFADKYPDAVKQYVSALNEAVKVYRSDPEAAAKTIAPELGIPVADSKAAMSEIIWLDSSEQKDTKYLGTATAPGEFAKILKDSAEFMVAQKSIPNAPDLTVYQKSFYTQAL